MLVKRGNYLFLNPYIRLNPKWIRELNIHTKTIQVLEENIGEFLYYLCIGKDFQTIPQNSDAINEKIFRFNYTHMHIQNLFKEKPKDKWKLGKNLCDIYHRERFTIPNTEELFDIEWETVVLFFKKGKKQTIYQKYKNDP